MPSNIAGSLVFIKRNQIGRVFRESFQTDAGDRSPIGSHQVLGDERAVHKYEQASHVPLRCPVS